ncbi:hypothetical protein ASZ90_009452 [hydrocarbon metagenome]|uniref:Single Cache domain-containing protein n=1 Tax=hydrocarbon metagenome TaxID=938273 RepID=A0A0W8FJB6_9ZZZZ
MGIIVCLLAAAAFSGCVGQEEAAAAAGPEALRSFVLDAADYAGSAGREAAIEEFGSIGGDYTRDEWYIYAYDNECILLAHPYAVEFVGSDRSGWTDIRGLPVIRIGRDIAAAGGGYLAYLYPRPADGGIDEGARETYEPKLGYVHPAGEGWWIGSGIPLAFDDGERYPEPVAMMIDLVSAGVSYAHAEGSEAALAEISDPDGLFVDGEGHYLYAYRYDGTLIAHPHLPELIGTNLIEKEDIYGVPVIRSLTETAREGGGFIVFIWPNPKEGNRDELKIGYVLPVDGEWWLGSGVYLSEITGEHTPLAGN